jgi:hypothetical protein
MSGLTTFLSKAGKIILDGISIFTGFNVSGLITAVDPKAGGVVQTISKDLSQIGDAVIQAEAIGQALNLPGAQKLIGATGPVSQIILDSALVAGKPIAQPDLFKRGSTKVADGMADILNSLHPDAATQIKPQDAAKG